MGVWAYRRMVRAPIRRSADLAIRRYADTPIRRYADTPTPRYAHDAPRLPRHSRLLARRAREPLRAGRAHARRQVRREAARRQIAGDDLHEVEHAYACLVRGRHLPARRPRAVSVAARRSARPR